MWNRTIRRSASALIVGACLVAAARAQSEQVAAQPDPPSFEHPLGLAMHHPRGWRVEETPWGLSLAPPDRAMGSELPRELYLLNAIGMPNDVATLDDPRVAKHLSDVLLRAVPFLRSSGPAQPVAGTAGTGLPGARTFRWSGTDPSGKTIVALIHGRAERGYFLSAGAIGERVLVERREPELARVFASLVWGEPKLHPRLVGTWHSESYASSGSVSSDRIHLSHRQTFVLGAQGRVHSSSEMGVSGSTGGHERPGTSVAGLVEGAPELGSWAATDEHVYLLWRDGGAAKLQYFIQGPAGRREMLLTPVGGGAKQLWTEY